MEKLKLRVIKDMFYVSEDLTSLGVVSREELENSYTHLLVVGDVWIETDDEFNSDEKLFTCVEGKWKDEINDGWWDYEDCKDYFEVIS